jgi:hypothetical protein
MSEAKIELWSTSSTPLVEESSVMVAMKKACCGQQDGGAFPVWFPFLDRGLPQTLSARDGTAGM